MRFPPGATDATLKPPKRMGHGPGRLKGGGYWGLTSVFIDAYGAPKNPRLSDIFVAVNVMPKDEVMWA